MAYTLQWLSTGVIKHFSGAVTFDDVIKSEREIAGSHRFTELRYVISDYMNVDNVSMTQMQRQEVRALRIGGFYSNPRIRYAFATQDQGIKDAIEQSELRGDILHPVKVFSTIDAHEWVRLSPFL